MRFADRLLRRVESERATGSQIQLFETYKTGPVAGTANDYASYANEGYAGNGPVFSVMLLRMSMMAEATDKIGVLDRDTRKVDIGHPALDRLRFTNLRALARRAEMHASLSGNAYVTYADVSSQAAPPTRTLRCLRPDRVKIVCRPGSTEDDPTDIIGYVHTTNGTVDRDSVFLRAEEVAHWAPEPHATKPFGMSWLTPVASEIDADNRMNRHTNKFFENGATPNLLLKVEHKLGEDVKKALVDALESRHQGWQNAYRPLLLEDGLDATVVGLDFDKMTFTSLAAAGENRIATASGVPPQIVGFSEGLDSSTYTNYTQAFRAWVDTRLRDHWGGWFNALSTIVPVPSGMELSYNERLIPALQQDAKDDAEIRGIDARTVQTYIMSGFTADSASLAVQSGDVSVLEHTGGIPTTLYESNVQPSGPSALPSGTT